MNLNLLAVPSAELEISTPLINIIKKLGENENLHIFFQET